MIELTPFPGPKVGDRVTMPAPPPTRWQRFKAWVTRVPYPATQTLTVTAVSSSAGPA